MCLLTYVCIVVMTTTLHVVTSLLQICPTPQPCHCTGIATSRDLSHDDSDNDDDAQPAVVCSFLRLRSVPYFLTFDTDVWTELDLSQNLLETIPAGALDGVRVRRLRLNRNDITSVEDDAFQGVGPEMEMIDISHNRLVRLKLAMVFRYLTRLRVLRMRYNSLIDIGSPATSDNVLPAVVELDLTGNEFDYVPSRELASLPALRRLILRDNRIRHIGSSAFASSAFLELIDVGANRFSRSADGGPMTIDSQAFCGLEPRALSRSPGVTDWTGLQQVRLDHNGLTQPELCSLMGIWTLVDVELSGNPLRCDCRLLTTLRRLINTALGLRVDHATQCASPDRLAGQNISEALWHWQPACRDDDVDHTCDELPCTAPLSLASSSTLLSVTGSALTPCVCAVALACALVRIVTSVQPRPRRTCSYTCRTAWPQALSG